MALQRRNTGRSTGVTKRKFKYVPPTQEAIEKRTQAGADNRNSMYSLSNITFFTPSEGQNVIRILPPTWNEPSHFGYDISVHYDIDDADKNRYFCLNGMKSEDCPVCESRGQAFDDGDDEYAGRLKPSTRILIWLIDRNNESAGVQLWSMPYTLNQNIMLSRRDRQTGQYLIIEDPASGYDISFYKEGKGLSTTYKGVTVDRESSKLGEDAWLDYAVENSLPDILKFYTYDHIKSKMPSVDLGDASVKGKVVPQNDVKDVVADDLDAEDIRALTYEALLEYAESKGIDITQSMVDTMTDEQLADHVCVELGLQEQEIEPEPEPEKDVATKLRAKLKRLKSKKLERK